MQAPLLHRIRNQNMWLSGERCIFWENENALIVSDLHFGKSGHFRKSGIPIPQTVFKEDLQRLVNLLQYFKPGKLIVVGDFFHSHQNIEMDWFSKWRSDFSNTEIILVKGNHDILKETWYSESSIQLIEKELNMGDFVFTHDKCEERDDKYIFCGHVHPGVVMYGAGKQTLRFPCFYFTKTHCILPAFSRFTGMATIHPSETDELFAVVENKLIKMQ
jgi:DNA ligase-associated metallophosphoesterase